MQMKMKDTPIQDAATRVRSASHRRIQHIGLALCALMVAVVTAGGLVHTGFAAMGVADTDMLSIGGVETGIVQSIDDAEANGVAEPETASPASDIIEPMTPVVGDGDENPQVIGGEAADTAASSSGKTDNADEPQGDGADGAKSDEAAEDDVAVLNVDKHEEDAEEDEAEAADDEEDAEAGIAAFADEADKAIMPADPSVWNVTTASKANEWQVVDGRYAGNTAEYKNASASGDVRVQKNVVPTDTENEFLVYLSIDIKTQIKNYFEHAQYQATTSNNYHAENVGTLVKSMTGNQSVQVSGTPMSKWNSALFTIKAPNGETLAEEVQLYWSQSNNVTFFLKLSEDSYVLMAVQVRKDGAQNVTLSPDAYDAIVESMASQTVLETVDDVMGEYVEFQEIVATWPGNDAKYDAASRTLTWTPKNMALGYTEVVTETDDTESIWYKNVAQLVYRVKLNVTKAGFASCARNMQSSVGDEESYAVNKHATLTYKTSDSSATKSIDFPVPHVRGLLYAPSAYKVGQTEVGSDVYAALAGAEFELSTMDGTVLATGVSGDGGMIAFKRKDGSSPALPWGTYLLKETKAPAGYDRSLEPTEITLCYTNDQQSFAADDPSAVNCLPDTVLATKTSAALQSHPLCNDLTAAKKLLLKKAAEGTTRPLAGATFTLSKLDASGAVEGYVDAQGVAQSSKADLTTDDNGTIFDGSLENGTYRLEETAAPQGYIKLEYALTLTVTENGIAIDDPNASDPRKGALLEPEQDVYVYTVSNSTGFRLPDTGGSQSLPLQAIGGAVVLACVSIGLLRIRRKVNRSRA